MQNGSPDQQPVLQPKVTSRRPTPAVQYGNVCLPQARNKPLPPVPMEEMQEVAENDYKNLTIPPEPDEDYLVADEIAYHPESTSSGSLSDRPSSIRSNPSIASESSAGVINNGLYQTTDEYNMPNNCSEYSELPDFNEYNDFVANPSTIPLPPVPTVPPAPSLSHVSQNSTHQDRKSNILSPTATKTPELLQPKSQVRRQAVMPPGLNTQRIKEVRQNLRPSLSNLPDFGLPPSPRVGGPDVDASVDGLEDPSAMSLGARKKLFEATVGGTGGSRVVIVAGQRTRIGSTVSKEQSVDGLTSPPSPAAAAAATLRQAAHPTSVVEQLDRENWFLGQTSQQQCQERLISRGWTEGEFVVRSSHNQGHPFALLVVHDAEIFTLPVRRKQNGKYALGSHKPGEPEFESVTSLVRHHQQQPILLVVGDPSSDRKSTGGQVLLQSECRRVQSCSADLIYDDVGILT